MGHRDKGQPLPFSDSVAREFGMFLVTLADRPAWKRDLALIAEAARVFGREHSNAVLLATAKACIGRAVAMMGGGSVAAE